MLGIVTPKLETAQLMAKCVTNVAKWITSRRSVGKSLTPGPKAMGGGVKVVKIYENAVGPKERT